MDVGPHTAAQALPRGTESILLIEDESSVRQVIVATLGRLGYRVVEAASGHAALDTWQKLEGKFDLVLTDMALPEGITGWELCNRFKAQNPGLKVIIMSGYSVIIAKNTWPAGAQVTFLPKPFTPQVLAQTIRESLDCP